jgi:ABC-type amino acid transport substrate-binding protein
VGFDVDVAERVGRILGLQVEFKTPAWDYVPRGLRRGLSDVSIGSMEITPPAKRCSTSPPPAATARHRHT